MIVPTASDIVACIEGNIASKVEPHLTDMGARSAVATIRHMLRHVGERIAHEGQVLTDDIVALRALLPDLATYLAQRGGDRMSTTAAAIREVLDRQHRAPGAYPDLTSLCQEAGALRQALYDALELLHSEEQPPEGRALHERVRAYIKAQIDAETALIEPAFVGHGPRR